MRNKVIAGLTALALLVGTAVPVFAAAPAVSDDGVSITYSGNIIIPASGSGNAEVTATFNDANNLTESNVVYSIPDTAGLIIDASNGKLTATSAAKPGKVTVTCTYDTAAKAGILGTVTNDASIIKTPSIKTDAKGELIDETITLTASDDESSTAGGAWTVSDGWTLNEVADPTVITKDGTEAAITIEKADTPANGTATIAVKKGFRAQVGATKTVEVTLAYSAAATLTTSNDSVAKAKFSDATAKYTIGADIKDAIITVYTDSNKQTVSTDSTASLTAEHELTLKAKSGALKAGDYYVTQKTASTSESATALKLTVSDPSSAVGSVTFAYGSTKLTSTTDKMEYSVDGGAKWTACTATDTTLSATEMAALSADKDIIVRVKDDPLDKKVIDLVTQEAPVLTSTQATTNDGKIAIASPVSGASSTAYEYKLASASAWSGATLSNSEITALTSGQYQVRLKGDGLKLPGAIGTVTVLANGATKAQVGIEISDAPTTVFVINGGTEFDNVGMKVVKVYNDGSRDAAVVVKGNNVGIATTPRNGDILTINNKEVTATWGGYTAKGTLTLTYVEIGSQSVAVKTGTGGEVVFKVNYYASNGLTDNTMVLDDSKLHAGITEGTFTKTATGKYDLTFDVANNVPAGSYTFTVKNAAGAAISNGTIVVSPVSNSNNNNTGGSTSGSSGNRGNSYYSGATDTTTTGALASPIGVGISGDGISAGATLGVAESAAPATNGTFSPVITSKANTATKAVLDGIAKRGIAKAAYDIVLNGSFTGELELALPGDKLVSGQSYTVLHILKDGSFELLKGTVNSDGKLIVKTKSLSPFIVLNSTYSASELNASSTGSTTSTVPKTGVELLAPLF